MDLEFYFDTAVLGPTYEDGYRHLVLSVSAAWEGDKPPGDERLQALLQPWRWKSVECVLYRAKGSILEQLPDEVELRQIELEQDWEPVKLEDDGDGPFRKQLESLYLRCTATDDEDSHHHFSLGAAKSGSDSDEAPDLRNGQHWPDLLASAGRWPGLLPYRLNLQIAFRLKADAIVPDALYFIVPKRVETRTVGGAIELVAVRTLADNGQTQMEDGSIAFSGQGEVTADYRWIAGAAIATARIGGRAAPDPKQVEATGALLDLNTLWGRPDEAGAWTSHDWFAAVPGLVAEAFDQPDGLFDVLTELAATTVAGSPVPEALDTLFRIRANRDALIDFATEAWQQRYGELRRRGGDGNHPLLSVLRAALGDAYEGERMDALPENIPQELSVPSDAVRRRLDTIINSAAVADGGKIALALPFFGHDGDGLDKHHGLDFLREAARTFAWLVSDAGLFAISRLWWLPVVEAVSTPQSPIAKRLLEWLDSEASDAFPLGALVRESWVTYKDANGSSPVRDTVDALHARMTKEKSSAIGPGKTQLVALISDVINHPLPANMPLRDCLRLVGLIPHPVLEAPLRAALGRRIKTLARGHLDGDARADRPELAGYPAAFGDPWPLDRVHDLMFPIDRPGHVDSDDGHSEDLRRQIAGIGLLVRQAGKPWHCLATASIFPDGASSAGYPALSGQPAAFSGELRTTMVAYRGEPWFERRASEALAVGYAGEAEDDSALTDVQAMAHLGVTFPDLKFGQHYDCAPFIIGPGNALPAELCEREDGARLHPARSRSELFSSGGIPANGSVKGSGPYHYLRRVPVGAPLLAPDDSGTLFSRTADVHPLAHEVLTGTEWTEQPLTLLCPSLRWLGKTEQTFHLQPPEVDMMVWLRHWRALIAAESDATRGKEWKTQLERALGAWMAHADAIADQPGSATSLPKFHDPAHDAYWIEVQKLWPEIKASKSEMVPVERIKAEQATIDGPGSQTRLMPLRIVASNVEAPTINGTRDEIVIAGLQAGCVYRISVSALVRAERFADDGDVGKDLQGKKCFAPAAVFGKSVGPLTGVAGYVRFAPRTVLAEVAIEALPIAIKDPTQASTLKDALKCSFDGRMLSVAADFSKAGDHDWCYVRTLILERQRWAWAGRHVDEEDVAALVPNAVGVVDRVAFDPATPKAFEDWGFLDRSDDYVREFAASAANDPRTVVWREDLQSRRAAEYHRFRLRARSRYAGLMNEAQKAETGMVDWVPYALKFRPGSAALPRPKIAMVLPLTGGYEEVKNKPRKLACLVQLDEAAFDEAGLPERIVVEAEIAGPDPILAGERLASALSFDCKTHGPIGHSFDPDMPGAKYRRASWVTSFETPVGDAATEHPWPLVKLRVHREVDKHWVWPLPQDDLESETVSAGWIQLPRPSDQILVRGALNKALPVIASALRLRRDAAAGTIRIVPEDDIDAAPFVLEMEPGFDAMFAVLTYQAIDARGIPGAEQILAEAAISDSTGPNISVKDLRRAPPGTLRLRLLTVQRNPKGRDNDAWHCKSLSNLFDRVGKNDTSDARFRLMRVSLPLMEADG